MKAIIKNHFLSDKQISEAVDRSTAIAELSPSGYFLQANENFVKIFGLTQEEIIGKHHSLVVSPQMKESSQYKSFWNDLSQGRYVSGEFERRDRLGQTKWINGSYNPVLRDGKVHSIIKFATDITEQKNLSLNLEQQYKAINKSNAVAVFDVEGNILDANQNFCSIFSYEVEEIVNKHHSIFVPLQDQNEEYQNFWNDLKRGVFRTGEYKRLTRTGREVWIRGSYNPIMDSTGKVYKIMKFALNVTQEKELFHSYASQLTAINRSNAIAEFSVDGIITYANDNFLNIFSYTAQEIIGKHHSMLLPPGESESKEYKEFWKNLRGGQFLRGEFKRKSRIDKEVWVRGSYNPIICENGKVEKIIKFALDVTEQKKLEEALNHDKLIIANQSKLAALGQMAAGVAHEVNNPLTVIRLKIEDVIDYFNEGSVESHRDEILKELNGVYKSTDRITNIIQSLKKYSKNEDNQESFAPVDLRYVLNNVLDFSKNTLSKSQVKININFEQMVVLGEETSLAQVFINLINNSLQALEKAEKGQDKKIEISSFVDDHHCYLRFCDSGPGIKEEVSSMIFNPFFTTKGPHGTGLGLSLCSQIMKAHEGTITHEPSLSKSCFLLKFPLKIKQQMDKAS